ncbi:MAG TPA: hypothetical protein PKD37_02855 [Oligoflexia bacterium]|nr:hypothetical protein [Oligoflexia bacterium]HMP26906.1 hypothetical protein [Oligoflexia bacterium]
MGYPVKPQYFFVFFLFVVLEILLRLSGVPYFNTHIIGGAVGDGGLYFWLSNIVSESIFSLPWFEIPQFYPHGLALAWSDSFILPALFWKIILSFGVSEALSYNLLLLLAETLNGFCSFLLLRVLKISFGRSILGGVAVMSLPYFSANLGHPQLLFFFFIPLALRSLYLFNEKPTALSAFSCGVILSLSFLCSVYYTIFIGVIIFLFVVLSFLRGEFSIKRFSFALIPLPFLYIFIAPYLVVKQSFGARRLYEPFAFKLSVLNLLPFSGETASSFSFFVILSFVLALISTWKAQRKSSDHQNIFLSSLFQLLATLVLLSATELNVPLWLKSIFLWIVFLFTLSIPLRTKKELFPLSFTLLIFWFGLLFSLGPPAENIKNISSSFYISPYHFLFDFFPGFDSLRDCSRFVILSHFALVVSLLLLLEKKGFKKNLKEKLIHLQNQKNCLLISRFSLILLILSILFNLFDSQAINFGPIPKKLSLPNYLNEKVVLSLPLVTTPLDKNGEITSWKDWANTNMEHLNSIRSPKIKSINGYSGQRPRLHQLLPKKFANFPDERSLMTLAQFPELEYIILRLDKYPVDRREYILSGLAKYSNYLEVVRILNELVLLIKIKSRLFESPSTRFFIPARHDYRTLILLFNTYESPPKITINRQTTPCRELVPSKKIGCPLPRSLIAISPLQVEIEGSKNSKISEADLR